MIPAVAFVGASQVGKTTLIEQLIPEFERHNCRVAVIKHAGHAIAVDTPLKDSWRFSEAGCDSVVVASDETAFMVQRGKPIEVESLLRLVEDHADIALVEGYKRSTLPKIEVRRRGTGVDLPSQPDGLLAVVTDQILDIDLPQFDICDVAGIAGFLVERLVGRRGDDVQVSVNGTEIHLKPFMKLLVGRTILGMMSAMK